MPHTQQHQKTTPKATMTKKAAPTKEAPVAKKAVAKAAGKKATKPAKAKAIPAAVAVPELKATAKKTKPAAKKSAPKPKDAAAKNPQPKHHTVFLLEDYALDDMLAFCSKEAACRFMASTPDIFDDPDENILEQEIVREKDGIILAAPPAKVYVFSSDDDGVICVFRNAREARKTLLQSVMDPAYDQCFDMLELVVRK